MKYPVITINHRDLSVNLMDIAFANRLVSANTDLQAAMAAAETEHVEDALKLENAKIAATCAFFDAAFGPGTASRLFMYRNEVLEYMGSRQSSRTISGLSTQRGFA